MTRRTWGFLCAGSALVVVVAGGGGFRSGPAAAFELCALGAAAFAGSLRTRCGPPLAGGVGCLLAGVTLLSAALAPYPFAALDRWALWAAALLLAWSIARLERACDSAEAGRRAVARLVLGAGLGAAALQVAGELGWHPGGDPERVSVARLHGSFASGNHLAEFLLLLVFAVLPFVSRRSAAGWGLGALAALATLGIAGGSSRIAPVALACGLAVWAATRLSLRSLPRSVVLLGLLAGVLLLGAAARIVAHRSGESEAWRRPQIWASVAPAMHERPLLGLGPGSFRHAHLPYAFPVESRVGRFGVRATTPHGEWLRLPIELGLLGCLLLALLLALRLREGLGRGAWPLLAALAPVALVHDFLQAPAIAAWTAAALVLCTEQEGPQGTEPAIWGTDAPRRSLALAAAAALAVAGLVVRPTLADSAARAGDIGSSLAWNSRQPHRWLEAGDRAAAGAGDPARLAAAMLCYQEAEAAAPRLAEPPRRQARLLAEAARRYFPEAGSRDAAAAAWDRAAALSPHDAFLRVEQGVFLAQTGASERAGELAREALALEPSFTDAALLALVAARGSGEAEGPALARALEALAAVPELRRRALSDFERDLIEPSAGLLEAARLTDRSPP